MTVVRNPRSATEADIAAASLDAHNVGGFKGLCDHAVGLFYGWGHTGAPTAYDHWLSIPSDLKHPGNLDAMDHAPFGALLFYKGAKNAEPGHVGFKRRAVRRMFATDGVVVGQVADTDIHQPHDVWGMIPLGWAAPYFPHGTAAIRTANRVWPEPVTTPAKRVPIWYVVHSGDTLSGIAKAHGLTLTALLNLNKPPYRSTPLRASTPIYAGSRVIVGLH